MATIAWYALPCVSGWDRESSRLAFASRARHDKQGSREASQGRQCATLVSLALVQNRHTDAILAPALYTNLSGAPCVCVCLRLRVSSHSL